MVTKWSPNGHGFFTASIFLLKSTQKSLFTSIQMSKSEAFQKPHKMIIAKYM
jgi:hypothetical protein